MSDIRDEAGPSVLNPHQSCYAKYQGVVCPWCRIAALEAEQGKINDELSILDICQVVPLVKSLEAENERLKESHDKWLNEPLPKTEIEALKKRIRNWETVYAELVLEKAEAKAAGKREAAEEILKLTQGHRVGHDEFSDDWERVQTRTCDELIAAINEYIKEKV